VHLTTHLWYCPASFLGVAGSLIPGVPLKFADTRELPTGSRSASTPVRILLIDRDLMQARQLASQLSRRQYETTTAATTNEAIRGIRLFSPKLILIDAEMLESAPTALESLRRASPETSIVVISGDTRPDQVFRLSKLGADEFLAKPVDLTDLEARIGRRHRCGRSGRISPCYSAPAPRWKM
jgi:DNA-binding response OmpR family regulator